MSVLQRLAVAASCVIFYFLAVGVKTTRTGNVSLLVTLALLACIEKICSVLNMISVDRDWVRITFKVYS